MGRLNNQGGETLEEIHAYIHYHLKYKQAVIDGTIAPETEDDTTDYQQQAELIENTQLKGKYQEQWEFVEEQLKKQNEPFSRSLLAVLDTANLAPRDSNLKSSMNEIHNNPIKTEAEILLDKIFSQDPSEAIKIFKAELFVAIDFKYQRDLRDDLLQINPHKS